MMYNSIKDVCIFRIVKKCEVQHIPFFMYVHFVFDENKRRIKIKYDSQSELIFLNQIFYLGEKVGYTDAHI